MALSLSKIIQLNLRIASKGLSYANFAMAVMFAPESELPSGFAVDTRKVYGSLEDLSVDFASTTETYKAAATWLGGIPTTDEITVYGRATADADWDTTLNKARNQFWWFWTMVDKATYANETDVLAIAKWCNTQNQMFINSQTGTACTEIRDINDVDDIGHQLSAFGYRTTYTFAHATDPYAGNALAKHFAAVNYSGANTTITGEYRKLSGIKAEDLTSTEQSAMIAAGVVWYGTVDNQGSKDVGRVLNSVTHSTYGEFIDDVVNLAAFSNSISVNLYNTISSTTYGKLGQDPIGQAMLLTRCSQTGQQYITNGYLGPRNYLDPTDAVEKYTTGFEILTKAEDILNLSDADRAERKAAPIGMQIFRKNAIHTVALNIDVF